MADYDINSLPYNRSGRNNTGKTIVYGVTAPKSYPVSYAGGIMWAADTATTKKNTPDPVNQEVLGVVNQRITAINTPSKVPFTLNSLLNNKGGLSPVSPYVAAKKASGGGKGQDKPTTKPPGDVQKPEYVNPVDWKWNLPPHRWSMPMTKTLDNTKSNSTSEMYRRGRLWWKMDDPSLQKQTGGDDKVVTSSPKADRKYGFQFLWNPEAFSTSVAVQMDVTPTAADRFLGGAGFFPATEGISFNIRIDRTNDFACAAASFASPDSILDGISYGSGLTTPAISFITADQVEPFKQYYQTLANDATVTEKLIDLFQRGTLADLEYLYKAINGIGPSGSVDNQWINGRGTATADIGFLTPTLLNVDIGPLSYQGYVNNLTVNHVAFTQNMVPIRTDVTIQLQLLATAGLINSGTSTAGQSNLDPQIRQIIGK